ncbi:MAG: hypothetical protein CNIPEHKO_01471 [Anaerolineales bacterium]|nr:hypothetical protein [Anaerolineales bacterium]
MVDYINPHPPSAPSPKIRLGFVGFWGGGQGGGKKSGSLTTPADGVYWIDKTSITSKPFLLFRPMR